MGIQVRPRRQAARIGLRRQRLAPAHIIDGARPLDAPAAAAHDGKPYVTYRR